MKFYFSRLFTTLSTLCLCGLIVLLSACNSQSASTSTSPQQNTNPSHKTPTTHQAASTTSQVAKPTVATSQTTPLPQTDTSCPAAGTARPAIMSSLVLGTDQNIVYSDTLAFKRYDTQTQSTTTILNLPSGSFSSIAQISADGQWILFLSNQTNARTKMQLVRIDGQELQTLYCFTNGQLNGQDIQDLQDPIQWSPDEKFIAFAVKNNNQNITSSILLLDITTGTLKTLFQGWNTDFYGRISWLDNTHLYVDSEVRSTGALGTLSLIDVTTVSANNPGFQTVLTYTANNGIISYNSSSDGKNLVFSSYGTLNSSSYTTITVKSATGDHQQALFHENAYIPTVRIISSNTLFMIAQINSGTSSADDEIWTMHFDGSDQQVVATLPPTTNSQGISNSLNKYSQFPWADISRDGNSYAIAEVNYGGGRGITSFSILIGSLSGGNPTKVEIPYPTGNPGADAVELNIVGWTTM
jgi:hypothetical protein